MNSTKTSRVSKGEHLSEMFFTLLPHIYLTVLCHCLHYHCRSMICHYQCAPSNQCSLYLCLSILCLSFCFGADCLYVCFSASSMSPCVCVCRPSLVLPVSVRPSSISGQPTSAPTTPTAAGSAAYATLFPTSLTVHSFVSLHQYCCPSTDQSLQQEDR